MEPIERLAPLKVNLFMEVLGRRDDGYHEVFTVMEALDVGDRVTVSEAPELIVSADRADVPDGRDNLVFRIVRSAEAVLGVPLPARIDIAKRVPPGSGFGAGSSDAVAALKAVLKLHGVSIPAERMARIAASVGSDTAFFVQGGTAVCRGRGERVDAPFDGGERVYVVVWGGPQAATPNVYGAVDLDDARRDGDAFVAALTGGACRPFNRLEAAAFTRLPALRTLAAELERVARRRPVLSGSGSGFFFIMGNEAEAAGLARLVEAETGLSACVARTAPAEAE